MSVPVVPGFVHIGTCVPCIYNKVSSMFIDGYAPPGMWLLGALAR